MTADRDDLPEFARDLDDPADFEDALAALACAAPPVTPRPAARAQLLAAVRSGPERFAPFFGRLAAMLELGVTEVRRVLADAEDRARWSAPGLPGLSLFHFTAGPSLATADTGLVELAPGTPFPEHVHVGWEKVLILSGGYRDSSGRVFRAGDSHESPAGSSHSYVVLPDAPCLFCVVLERGITIDGQPFG